MLSNTGKLAGHTLFVTGASRGIGKAIALKAAKDGANVIIAAKTADPHPKLPGTIYTAAKEVEAAGGKCLPCIVDVRSEEQVKKAVEEGVKKFGGIDILINNASAISLTSTEDTDMKRYDLMHNINTRGTFLASKICIPYLKKSARPHILNISPPLDMSSKWFSNHVAYTMAKFGMSMCVLGMSQELRGDGIAVNALWPRTAITTAAMDMLAGGEMARHCRKPDIMADAAYAIITKDKSFTGNFCVDEHILRDSGIKDFAPYSVEPGQLLMPDFFLADHILKDGEKLMDLTSYTAKVNESVSSPKSSGGADASPVGKIFDSVKTRLSEELCKKISGVYQFTIKGKADEDWFIDLKNAPGASGKGAPPSGKADVIFITDPETFVKMFKGETKATNAFMSGKLRLKGDMGLAMKLEKLMKEMVSSKL